MRSKNDFFKKKCQRNGDIRWSIWQSSFLMVLPNPTSSYIKRAKHTHEGKRGRKMAIVAVLLFIPTAILFLIVLLHFRGNEKLKASKKLPPGNFCAPLIGETFSILKPHPSNAIGDFMEHRMSKFGKVFSSNVLGDQTIVSADAALNRFVLKNDTRLFVSSWPYAVKKLFGEYSMPEVVGDEHKLQRNIMVGFLSGERLRTAFLQDADQFAVRVLNTWNEGSLISAANEATKFSLYIIAKKVLSLSPEDPRIEVLQREYDSYVKGLRSIPINLPGTTYSKASKSRDNIIELIKQEIRKRMEENGGRSTHGDDLLSFLMKNTDLSQEKIGDMVLNTMFAGHDTTKRAVSCLIYFLEACPKAIQQLRDEHLHVLRSKQQNGERKFAYEDYKTMEITQCVINETLRMSNIAAIFMRKAKEDIEFKGHVIPKGHKVLLNTAPMHLDPSLYDNPANFNPWRWQGSFGVDIANNFMPFGSGVRACPGQELARLEMAVFLHHLILKYDWELAESDMPMSYPSTEFPKGLPIKVRAVSTTM